MLLQKRPQTRPRHKARPIGGGPDEVESEGEGKREGEEEGEAEEPVEEPEPAEGITLSRRHLKLFDIRNLKRVCICRVSHSARIIWKYGSSLIIDTV